MFLLQAWHSCEAHRKAWLQRDNQMYKLTQVLSSGRKAHPMPLWIPRSSSIWSPSRAASTASLTDLKLTRCRTAAT